MDYANRLGDLEADEVYARADYPDPPTVDTALDDELADLCCEDCDRYVACPTVGCTCGWCLDYEEFVEGSTPLDECGRWER